MAQRKSHTGPSGVLLRALRGPRGPPRGPRERTPTGRPGRRDHAAARRGTPRAEREQAGGGGGGRQRTWARRGQKGETGCTRRAARGTQRGHAEDTHGAHRRNTDADDTHQRLKEGTERAHSTERTRGGGAVGPEGAPHARGTTPAHGVSRGCKGCKKTQFTASVCTKLCHFASKIGKKGRFIGQKFSYLASDRAFSPPP